MSKSMSTKSIRIFLEEAWRFPIRTTFSVTNAGFSVLLGAIVSPFIISRLLDRIQSGQDISLQALWPTIAMYAAVQFYSEILGWRLTLLSTWTMETAAQRNLYNRVFRHLTSQSMDFHANRFGGSLVSQTNKLIGSFERFWDTIIFQLTTTVVSLIAAIVVLCFVFWQYAVVLAIMSMIFVAIVLIGSRWMAKLNIAESQAGTKLTGRLADVITNILAVKSHGHEEYEVGKYDEQTKFWRARSLDSMWGFLSMSSVYSLMIVLLNVSALAAAIWAIENNLIQISVVYLSITYTFTAARQLWEMNNIMRNYNRIVGDAYDMTEILTDVKPEVRDTKKPEETKFARGSIDFDNVSFGHGHDLLFDKLNLHIKPGEKVGLVGHSGSGKTTLTRLLLRFMDIQDGTIRIDGQNIAKLRQSEFRNHVAYVPQEPLLFHRSLRDNIAYGQLDAEPAVIEGVAKLANAHEFIEKLPEGYDTLVGERGVKLSGGQRQRVAIARAMIKNAPILVLDEATSALDSESEELIQDALWKLMQGRTAIVIAHRLSTIQKMDRILVMDDGKIVEEGTHKELIRKKNGVYANLWNKQSGGFMEPNVEE